MGCGVLAPHVRADNHRPSERTPEHEEFPVEIGSFSLSSEGGLVAPPGLRLPACVPLSALVYRLQLAFEAAAVRHRWHRRDGDV